MQHEKSAIWKEKTVQHEKSATWKAKTGQHEYNMKKVLHRKSAT